MTILPDSWRSMMLAFAQGTLEFLPVSSSGHLTVLHLLLAERDGAVPDPVGFIILLHVATAAAAVTHYRREFLAAGQGVWGTRGSAGPVPVRLAGAALLVSGAVALPLMLLLSRLGSVWTTPAVIGGLMIANGVVLWFAPRQDPSNGNLTCWRQAALIGVAQGLAVLPGLSRSGLMLAVALWAGVDRDRAVAFALMLSPVVIGASAIAWAVGSWEQVAPLTGGDVGWVALNAFLVAYLTALASIDWLVRFVNDGRLHWFGPWSILAGVVSMLLPVLL